MSNKNLLSGIQQGSVSWPWIVGLSTHNRGSQKPDGNIFGVFFSILN